MANTEKETLWYVSEMELGGFKKKMSVAALTVPGQDPKWPA